MRRTIKTVAASMALYWLYVNGWIQICPRTWKMCFSCMAIWLFEISTCPSLVEQVFNSSAARWPNLKIPNEALNFFPSYLESACEHWSVIIRNYYLRVTWGTSPAAMAKDISANELLISLETVSRREYVLLISSPLGSIVMSLELTFPSPWKEPKQVLLTLVSFRQVHVKLSPVYSPGPISAS